MKRRVLAILLLLSLPSFAVVNVTGNLKDATGAAVNSATSFVRFQLVNCGSNVPHTASGVIAKTTVDLHPNAAGAIVGTLAANAEIQCGGGTTTQYDMTVFYNGTPGLTKRIVANADFNIAAPVYAVAQTPQPALPAPNYVQTNPVGSQAIVQPAGSALAVNGDVTVSGAVNDIPALTLSALDARYATGAILHDIGGGAQRVDPLYLDLSQPGPIGSVVPGTGVFTALTASSLMGVNLTTTPSDNAITLGGQTAGVHSQVRFSSTATNPDHAEENVTIVKGCTGNLSRAENNYCEAVTGVAFTTGTINRTTYAFTIGGEFGAGANSSGTKVDDARGVTAWCQTMAGTTTIDRCAALVAQAAIKNGGAITDSYGIVADHQTVGTGRNYSAWFRGNTLFCDQAGCNFDIVKSDNTTAPLIQIDSGNKVYFNALGGEWRFRTSGTGNTFMRYNAPYLEIDPFGVGIPLKIDVPNGTAPMVVDSSTKVTNLNVDMLDGVHVGNVSVGKAMCWKDATHLGYCSSVVAADGSCTCN